jgi:hypothetical protein
LIPLLLQERQVRAFEQIAEYLGSIANALDWRAEIEQERFDKQYPTKGEIADATITHLQSDEERLRASQGYSDESDEEWTGRREAKHLEAQAARARAQSNGKTKGPQA